MRKEDKRMAKKVLTLMLSVLMLAGLAAPLTANAVYEMYVYTANGGRLNVRDEPSANGKVVGHYDYGQMVPIDHDLGNGWSEVVWGSVPAYVQNRYLVSYEPAPAPTKAPATATPKPTMSPEDVAAQEEAKMRTELKSEKEVSPFYIEVRTPRATSWVNFRKAPSKATERLASYPDGQELIVLGETNRWYRARDPQTNVVGYIFKEYTSRLNKAVATEAPILRVEAPAQTVTTTSAQETTKKLGTLSVNGVFDLTCTLPASYDVHVINQRGGKILANIRSEDVSKPQLYLSIAYDEMYGDVERMNDLSAEQLAALEATFTSMNDVEITYQYTGHGTKLLVAREVGSDTDFVDILSIYKGYFIEFNMTPNPKAATQTLSHTQIGMCIDFLTDVDFVPVK